MNEVKDRRKNELRTLVVSVITVAVLIAGVIGASYAYFAAYVTGTAVTTGTITSKTVDNCIAQTLTATATINANQTNFAQGQTDKSANTTSQVMMHARNDAEAKCCYTAKVEVNASSFSYISGTTPEMVMTISRNGTAIVNNMDVTGKNNTYYLSGSAGSLSLVNATTAPLVAGASVIADGTAYENYTATLTFRNNTFVQNANSGKSATLKLTLEPKKTVLASASC